MGIHGFLGPGSIVCSKSRIRSVVAGIGSPVGFGLMTDPGGAAAEEEEEVEVVAAAAAETITGVASKRRLS
jgi:hypothetical protein